MGIKDDTFGWLEVERIGEELAIEHPKIDPVGVGFLKLKQLVEMLPGFRPDPKHPCNEKILEHIQAAWIEESSGGRRTDDDD